MSAISFTKMHGLGNDFVLFDGRRPAFDYLPFVETIADRRFGVGCDQVIVLKESPDENCDARMQILNADGSEVEMCGNGIRCFALWLWNHIGLHHTTYNIETPAGIIRPTLLDNGLVQVDMGPATFVAAELPVSDKFFAADQSLLDATLEVEGEPITFCGVQVGNPHFVTFVEDVEAVDLPRMGRQIENHPAFPNRINVEFVTTTQQGARVRVWERGSGATLACGTGATAVGAVLVARDNRRGPFVIELPGGVLTIDKREERMWMTGPAVEVFSGTLDERRLQTAREARNHAH